MKKTLLSLMLLMITFVHAPVHAREGSSIGIMGLGNFFLSDAYPEQKFGLGAGLYADYRFNQRWAIEGAVYFGSSDGRDTARGDNNMLLIALPTIGLKYYLASEESRFEPYLSAGLGLFILTDGSVENDSGGIGMGSYIGLGSDFYITEKLSLGAEAQFRTVGLIQQDSNSAALLNFSITARLGWHF